jgi:hypothetical protein
MDHYTAERLFLDRLHELQAAGERERLVEAARPGDRVRARSRLASWLRATADRIDGTPQLQRVV